MHIGAFMLFFHSTIGKVAGKTSSVFSCQKQKNFHTYGIEHLWLKAVYYFRKKLYHICLACF